MSRPWTVHDLGPLPGAVCGHCDDLGYLMERIDDERLPVEVPCHWCRRYCRECRKYVRKEGHTCQPRKEE